MTAEQMAKNILDQWPNLNIVCRVGELDESIIAALKQARVEGLEAAAMLHQDINGASDSERLRGTPGCDAFGAIIEYRDKIRALKEK